MFTPGPWEVETQYHDEEGYEQYIKSQAIIVRYKDGGSATIARINWSNPVKGNAHLIAAAPDMYKALKDHCDSCKAVIDMFFGNSNACEFCDFGKALAKAEGQAHE
jgi:hypothetical protein